MPDPSRPDDLVEPSDDGADEIAALDFETGVRQRGTEVLPGDVVDDEPVPASGTAKAKTTLDPVVRIVPARRRSLRRRALSAVVLVAALVGIGVAYSAVAQAGTNNSTDTAQQVAEGRQIFSGACITCHGANLQGVTDRGPSLIGTGGAATYFQVATGRMPLVGQGAQAPKHNVYYTQAQIDALVAYVQSYGGGPAVPTGQLRSNSNLGQGGQLFRLNCAQCHGAAGRGAPLSAGKYAPGLGDATDKQIWTAMLSGPESMPVFGDNQLTPEQKRDLIGYIQSLKASKNPGGAGLDRIGPVSEGIVIWVAGIGAMVLIILWIGRKAGQSAA